jgi:hypothetical protein
MYTSSEVRASSSSSLSSSVVVVVAAAAVAAAVIVVAAVAAAASQLEMCEIVLFSKKKSTFCCCGDSFGLFYSNSTHNSTPIRPYTIRKPEPAESTVPAEHVFLYSPCRCLCIVSSC